MAVCDVRGIVNGWNVADWSAVDLGANGHTRRVNSAVFLTDRLLATASEDKRVILWDLTTGRPLADQRFEHPAPVIDVMSVADGAKLLTVCRDGRLRAFDMKSSEPPKVLFESQPVGARSPEIRCAFDRSNGRMLIAELLSRIVPTESDRLHVLRLDEEQPGFEAAPRFNRRVNSLVLTPAGDSFLALEGRQVTMLSLEEGVAPRRFGRSGLVNSAEFSPDNQWIVVRKTIEDIVVVVKRQAKLLQVIFALRPTCCLTRLLYGRQQQRHKDGNDGNHDQKFDQSKSGFTASFRSHISASQACKEKTYSEWENLSLPRFSKLSFRDY
jgi:hypothetical protein